MTKTTTPATPDGLSPCPFCGCMLRHIEAWARRSEPPRLYHGYQHENNGCILRSKAWYFDDKPESRMAFITKWNDQCRHNWRYNGTVRGGSHEGEDCYRCSKCGAYTYVAEDEAQIQADQAAVDAVLASFNGGLVNIPNDDNPRGFVTHYRPRDAMRNALAALTTKADAAGEGVERAKQILTDYTKDAEMRVTLALAALSCTPSQANDAARKVERAAKAMAADDGSPEQWEDWLNPARAAVRALNTSRGEG